ncbi:hypothetical protein THRCLA_03615 [Thraustotheca clavata]|uniref:Asparagine synthetase domain-containing protein n=1 Tax=Thraustotheca clavata TaxID=74557 RepID=A0A1W0A1H6_9STRA|nr:hypothetical protein THRCLA_03615 [Thraustotheca clavata]
MIPHWSAIVKSLETYLKPKGLDLIVPLQVGWYNDTVPETYKIPLADNRLIVLIGNNKNLWQPFVDAMDLESISDHPLNDYSMRVVTEAVEHLETDVEIKTDKVYWVHETEPGKMVAAGRMVLASGMARLSDELHLSVHPTFGPWFAQRAVLTFNSINGPDAPLYNAPPLEVNPKILQAVKAELDHALTLSKRPTPSNWTLWLRPRITFAPTHPYMYSEAQVMFHYSKSIEDRHKIIRASKLNQPLDYILDSPPEAAVACRSLIQKVLEEAAANKPDAILLSGGLDTSIIAEASASPIDNIKAIPPIMPVTAGITVRADPQAQDAVYAKSICDKLKIKHLCIDIPIEKLLERVPDVSRHLVSFDPMELRNSIVIYESLLRAKKEGYKCVVTGDGADELFAGYSFYQSMDEEKLAAYRQQIAKIMRFTSSVLAASMGIRVISPFLDKRVIDFALSLQKKDLIGERSPVPNGQTHGKLVLRRAFPEATSQWRAKEPIEQGSGTTKLRMGYFDNYPDTNTPFSTLQADCYATHRVVIRDREHLYFFHHFLEAFNNDLNNVPLQRFEKEDSCPACGFALPSKDQDFCVTCGFWPARTTTANKASADKAMAQLTSLLDSFKL